MADFEVDSALESLVRAYRGEGRGRAPLPPRGQMNLLVYESARTACEVRLGRAPIPSHYKKVGHGDPKPVSVEVIVSCLNRSLFDRPFPCLDARPTNLCPPYFAFRLTACLHSFRKIVKIFNHVISFR